MKIVLPGGSGLIGTMLANHFHSEGHEVVVLSRGPKANPWKTVIWDGETLGDWAGEIEGADALINLVGRTVNCRYTFKNRCEIWSSRTRSVRVLGEAVSKLGRPPRVWLQAGTATIYAHRLDAANDEYEGIIGDSETYTPDTWRFSIDVARAWEGEFALVDLPRTRKVVLRTSIVMSPDKDSAFDYLLWLVRKGLGGTAGSGKQYISWIHYLDFLEAVRFILNDDRISGPVNMTAPTPLPNREFMALLRKARGRRFGLPVSERVLEIGAVFLGTESELVLKSRRVVPRRLLEAGFQFKFPDWESASRDLTTR